MARRSSSSASLVSLDSPSVSESEPSNNLGGSHLRPIVNAGAGRNVQDDMNDTPSIRAIFPTSVSAPTVSADDSLSTGYHATTGAGSFSGIDARRDGIVAALLERNKSNCDRRSRRLVQSPSQESNPTSWLSVSTATLDADIRSVPSLYSNATSGVAQQPLERRIPGLGAIDTSVDRKTRHHTKVNGRRSPCTSANASTITSMGTGAGTETDTGSGGTGEIAPLRTEPRTTSSIHMGERVDSMRRINASKNLSGRPPVRRRLHPPAQPPLVLPKSPNTFCFSSATSEASSDPPTPPSPSVILQRMMSTTSGHSMNILKVEMRMEAYCLLNKDTLSLSDPFAVLYADHFGIGLEELGRTETVYDDLNPRWQTRFVFPYRPSRHANVIIEIYDRDDGKEDAPLTKHDFLGRAEVDLVCVLDQPGGRLRVKLRRAEGVTKGRGKRGYISIFAEVLHDETVGRGIARMCPITGVSLSGIVVFNMNVAAMKKKTGYSICGSADVIQFYEVLRERAEADGSSSWTVIYRSEDGERINTDGYLEFAPVVFVESAVHNCQPHRQLRFVVYKRNVMRSHEVLGYAEISVSELVAPSKSSKFMKVPLRGEDFDATLPGNLQVTGVYRDTTRDDIIVIDAAVNMYTQGNYSSSLSASSCRKKFVNRGVSGYVRKQISLH